MGITYNAKWYTGQDGNLYTTVLADTTSIGSGQVQHVLAALSVEPTAYQSLVVIVVF